MLWFLHSDGNIMESMDTLVAGRGRNPSARRAMDIREVKRK
jgi:hypothetical protein